jgi:hypothetical protein
LQWDVRDAGVANAGFVSLMNWILMSLGVGGTGGMVIAAIRRYTPRVRRSYWWLLARHAILAQLFRLIPSMERDALVHGLKRALIEAVSPPVMQCRRVPANIEVILPANAVSELDGAGPDLTDDLVSWLVQQAQRRGWTLPESGPGGITIGFRADPYGIARRPRVSNGGIGRRVTRPQP